MPKRRRKRAQKRTDGRLPPMARKKNMASGMPMLKGSKVLVKKEPTTIPTRKAEQKKKNSQDGDRMALFHQLAAPSTARTNTIVGEPVRGQRQMTKIVTTVENDRGKHVLPHSLERDFAEFRTVCENKKYFGSGNGIHGRWGKGNTV